MLPAKARAGVPALRLGEYPFSGPYLCPGEEPHVALITSTVGFSMTGLENDCRTLLLIWRDLFVFIHQVGWQRFPTWVSCFLGNGVLLIPALSLAVQTWARLTFSGPQFSLQYLGIYSHMCVLYMYYICHIYPIKLYMCAYVCMHTHMECIYIYIFRSLYVWIYICKINGVQVVLNSMRKKLMKFLILVVLKNWLLEVLWELAMSHLPEGENILIEHA